MLAAKLKKEKKAAEAAAAAAAAVAESGGSGETTEQSTTQQSKKVSLFGVGGNKQKEIASKDKVKKRTAGEIRIQKGKQNQCKITHMLVFIQQMCLNFLTNLIFVLKRYC